MEYFAFVQLAVQITLQLALKFTLFQLIDQLGLLSLAIFQNLLRPLLLARPLKAHPIFLQLKSLLFIMTLKNQLISPYHFTQLM